MATPNTTRGNTTRRDRHRTRLARTQPHCALCGQPIDYTLRYPNPGSFVVDHITPINRGGTDTIDNLQPAHNACNRAKSDTLDGEQRDNTNAHGRYIEPITTTRTW